VQAEIRSAVDRLPAGRWRAVSLCAGDGRDLLGMLAGSPRRAEVSARLVELDPQLAGAARTAAARTGLTGVEVLTGDAGLCDAYIEAVPANLVHPQYAIDG